MKHRFARAALLAALFAAQAMAVLGTSVLCRVPSKARLRPNPLQASRAAAQAGAKLFARHCAGCHAASARGRYRGPVLNSAALSHASPGALFWIISNGIVRRGMPPWSRLPEPERWQIVTFLTSGSRPSPAPTPLR